jgi:hypothetical protein
MSEDEEFSKLSSIGKCPICGEELEKGYVVSGGQGGLLWHTQIQKWVSKDAERLSPPFAWTFTALPAVRCKQCRIAIFNYGKYAKECERTSRDRL